MLSDGHWLVSGGLGREGYVGTTQIYSEEKGWLEYVPMPGKLEGHCQVTVGDDIFVIGGTSWGHTFMGNEGVGFKSRSTFVLRNNMWHKLSAKLSKAVRSHACAVVGGLIYTVGGGSNMDTTVEILNTDKPEDGWVQGPQLPERVNMNIVQTVVHDNTLYVVSGNPRQESYQSRMLGRTPVKVHSLEQGGDHWEELQGVNITQRNKDNESYTPSDGRPVFPAQVLNKNHLHCSEPPITSESSGTSFDILFVVFLCITLST